MLKNTETHIIISKRIERETGSQTQRIYQTLLNGGIGLSKFEVFRFRGLLRLLTRVNKILILNKKK